MCACVYVCIEKTFSKVFALLSTIFISQSKIFLVVVDKVRKEPLKILFTTKMSILLTKCECTLYKMILLLTLENFCHRVSTDTWVTLRNGGFTPTSMPTTRRIKVVDVCGASRWDFLGVLNVYDVGLMSCRMYPETRCDTLQHTAHTATSCNKLHCNALLYSALQRLMNGWFRIRYASAWWRENEF